MVQVVDAFSAFFYSVISHFFVGVYQILGAYALVFRPVVKSYSSGLQELVEQIAGRIVRELERRGLLERDLENWWLATDASRPAGWLARPLDHLPHCSGAIGWAEAVYTADGPAQAAGTGRRV